MIIMNSGKEFFSVLDERRSIRKYKNKDIEKDKLEKILEAANSAPSAGNLQAYEIVLIKEKKNKRALAAASFGQDFIAQAPVVLVFCANPNRSAVRYSSRGHELYSIQDATIAASYAQLAATALGLGSVWVGAFDESSVSKIINAKSVKPVAIIPIGYPDEKPGKRCRRDLDDIVHNESVR